MKGLIIKKHWAELILNGLKTLELRGSNTKIRGTIAIIESGTGMVFGTVDLIDCIKLSEEDYLNTLDKHKVTKNRKDIPYKNLYGWVIENPVRYEKPIPYTHKQGCVIWVNL